MALKFYWRAENSTTLDGTNDYSANDTTAATTGTPSFSTTAAYKGTYGVLLPLSTTSVYRFNPTDIITNVGTPSTCVGSAAFMIRFPTAINTTTGIYYGFRVLNTGGTADSIQTVTGDDNGSGFMKYQLSIGNVTNGALTLSTAEYCMTYDVWYGVVIRWDLANNKRKIEVYNTSGTLIGSGEDTSTSLASNIPAALNEIRWGRSTGHANDVHIDNMFIGSTYDDPLQNNLNITSYTEYVSTTKKLKLLAHASAASASGVSGVVFGAPTGGNITGTKFGEFTSKTFEASLETGKAVLKVPVSDFGGSSLTTSDTPVALVRSSTKTTGIISCTVIEE